MDATFWALVGLILFFVLIAYLKVPGKITAALDNRADRIRRELEEARRLREEAQAVLAEYQRKRKESEAEAASIVDAAKREAKVLAADAKVKTEEYVARRTAFAEQKIAQAERDEIAEVRGRAVDIAIEAARKVLGDKVDAKAAGQLFQASVEAVKTKLN